MLKRTLEAVGLRTNSDIPAGEIFSSGLNRDKYGIPEESLGLISVLKDFVEEYNREIPVDTSITVTDSAVAADLMYNIMRGLGHEEIWAVFLNKANRVLSRHRISEGCLDAAILDQRKIVMTALQENASGIILYHCHPSGNPKPSANDIRETEKLGAALKLFEMTLVDHIIMTDTSFFAFSEEKTIKFKRS